MLIINSIFNVIDNSGVLKILCIGNLNKKINSVNVGDIIIGVVKKTKKNSFIKISSIIRALVVTSKKSLYIESGGFIKFSKNSVIILTKKYTPIATRVFESFYYKKLYYKLLKIKSINIK